MTTKSDFEKLVISQKYIEKLEREIELLKEEVQHQFGLRKKAEIELKIERNKKEKLTAEEKLKIKSDLYVRQQKEAIDSLRKKLNDCRAKLEKSEGDLIAARMKLMNEK